MLGRRPALFLVCLAAWTLTNMDQAVFGYAAPGILAEFHLPLSAIGLILTISFLASAALVVVAGVVADRIGRGLTLSCLLASSAIMVGLQGFAGGVVALTLFRALGFGLSGGLSPITNALVVENAHPRSRGMAMGLLQCGYPLGWFIASLFAAPLLQHYGWRAACFMAFAVVPLTAPIFYLVSRAAPAGASIDTARAAPRAAPPIANPARLLFARPHRRSSLAIMAIFFMFGGAYAGSVFFFPTFFTEVRGYTPSGAASLVGLSNGIAIFGYLGAAWVGEALMTRRDVFILWCLGGAVALLGLLWSSSSPLQDTQWFSVTAALFFGSQAVAPVVVAEAFPTEIRATALAICASAPLALGFAIFPSIVPIIVGAVGWREGLSLVVAPLLFGSAAIALFLPNRRSGAVIV